MKRMTRVLALVLTMLPLFAAAQLSSSDRIVAKVPFEFMAANKAVPAGEWSLKAVDGARAMLILNNVDASSALFSTASIEDSKRPAAAYALVFHKYGDRYFLSAVKLGGSKTMYRLPENKAEAELRAQNATPTETILLASVR
jgi:hypothetical protein